MWGSVASPTTAELEYLGSDVGDRWSEIGWEGRDGAAGDVGFAGALALVDDNPDDEQPDPNLDDDDLDEDDEFGDDELDDEELEDDDDLDDDELDDDLIDLDDEFDTGDDEDRPHPGHTKYQE